jgi:site-specific recombinase XerD
MKRADPFPALLRAFFYEWMVEQRNASAHTVRSYRDTWRLFLRFVAARRRRTVAQLTLGELTGFEVSAFLQYTEQERHDSIGTRNCRLAALRSFFSFVAGREPAAAAQCAEVLRIPTKKAPVHAPSYLDLAEVEAILAQPDRSTLEGQRDHALLSFLYNTGARIQEALDVCPQAVHLDSPACVRLFGKGRKERLCPLWRETVSLLKALLQRQPRADDERIFVNRYGVPLGASGVRFKLAEYVAAAAKVMPSLASKHVTPHSFRHATAVHLVAAGVDITVIRSWLGHVSLDTTNHYAQANLETKRKALERLDASSRASRPPPWRRDTSVLAWLDSL